MTVLSLIENRARALGACEKIDGIRDYRDLVSKMFIAGGTSWCVKNRYPKLLYFKMAKPYVAEDNRIYIDAGNIELSDLANVCLVGDTHATITYNGGRCIHKVLCYYGATAKITAQNKAVVRVFKVEAGDVSVEKDNSSIILREVTPDNAE